MSSIGPPYTILYLDHTAALSGGEIALLHLVERLDRTRFTPVVLVSSDGPLVGKLRDAGVEAHVLAIADSIVYTKRHDLSRKALLRLRDSLRVALYCVRVAQFARRRGASVIHSNSLKADLIGGVSGRLVGIPVIWHIRDRIEDDYLPPKVTRAFRWLTRILPAYVIANSAATWNTLRLSSSRAEGAAAKGCVVHDGVVVPAQLTANTRAHQSTVGIVGRISPWKGQHIFVQAVHLVHQHHPAVHFQIIGEAMFGEEVYQAELESLIIALHLENIVELLGFRSDIPELMRGMEILVHASTTGEPFGQVVVEAMIEGTPVIATDGGGIPEILRHGETGLLVPMNDAAALAASIEQLLADPAASRAIGRAGQQHAVENFDIQLTVRKVEDVYDRLLAPRQRSHALGLGAPEGTGTPP